MNSYPDATRSENGNAARAGDVCAFCKTNSLPESRTKYCSDVCATRGRQRSNRRNRRERGLKDFRLDFAVKVVRPLLIEDLAEKLGVDVEEARRRAEIDVQRGRLRAWRGPRDDGPIQDVGISKKWLKAQKERGAL